MRANRRPSSLPVLLLSVLGVLGVLGVGAGRAEAGLGRWTPVGPGGGTVSGLAADPTSPGTLWAAASNGVYKTTDGGNTWSWKTGGGDFRAVAADAADAADPDHPSIVYAAGNKIWKSVDGGETWDVALGGDNYIRSLAVAPGSGTVYAAADGLLRSAAGGGKPWKKVLENLVRQVVVDPSNPRTVYAVGESIYNDGLWKSVDGGDTWARVGPIAGSGQLSDVRAVAVAPSRPATLYAASGYFVYRSTDGGASWTEVGGGVPVPIATTLAVDPETPTTVYLGGSHGIAVSTDGGEHWVLKANGLPGTDIVQIQTLVFGAGTPRIVYAGMWDFGVARTRDGGDHWRFGLQLGLSAGGNLLEIDPVRAGTFYVSAAPGRTFRTTDGGQTWTLFATALGNVRVQDLAVDRFHPSTIYAGTPDGVFRSVDDGASWVRIDDRSSQILALADRGNAILSADFCGLRRSADGGQTWREVISCEAGDDLTVNILKLLTLPGRPAAHAVVHAGNGGGAQGWNLYTSRSSGVFWGEGIGALDVAVCLAQPATVYVADFAGLRRSDDGGRHWISLDAGLLPVSVAADPRNPRIVYVSGASVRRSTDGGLTWRDVSDGLAGKLGNDGVALVADPTTPGHLFARAGGGLFEATFPSS